MSRSLSDKVVEVRPTAASLVISDITSCDVCGKCFSNAGILYIHQRQHSSTWGPKHHVVPYQQQPNEHFFCPVDTCARFTKHYLRLSQLKEHYGMCHAPKRFQCDKCDKSFGLDSACKRHERACGLAYKCQCGKNFASVSGRNKHGRKTGHAFLSNSQLENEANQMHMMMHTNTTGVVYSSACPSSPTSASNPNLNGTSNDIATPTPRVVTQTHTKNPAALKINAGAQTLLAGLELESAIALSGLPSGGRDMPSGNQKHAIAVSYQCSLTQTQTQTLESAIANDACTSLPLLTPSMETNTRDDDDDAFSLNPFNPSSLCPVEGSTQTDFSFLSPWLYDINTNVNVNERCDSGTQTILADVAELVVYPSF